MMNNIARIPHIAAYNEFQLVDMMHSSEGCRGMAGENPGLGLRARNLFDDALARKHHHFHAPSRDSGELTCGVAIGGMASEQWGVAPR